jgi:hypothetical protein
MAIGERKKINDKTQDGCDEGKIAMEEKVVSYDSF